MVGADELILLDVAGASTVELITDRLEIVLCTTVTGWELVLDSCGERLGTEMIGGKKAALLREIDDDARFEDEGSGSVLG